MRRGKRYLATGDRSRSALRAAVESWPAQVGAQARGLENLVSLMTRNVAVVGARMGLCPAAA